METLLAKDPASNSSGIGDLHSPVDMVEPDSFFCFRFFSITNYPCTKTVDVDMLVIQDHANVSPHPASLPFFAGIQFSRDSIRGFNEWL